MPSRQQCPQCKRTRWIPRYTAPWCTPSCKRAALAELATVAAGAVVGCCVCGYLHNVASGDVLYRSADQRWWCADEVACRERERQHQAEVAAMQRALDDVWLSWKRAGGGYERDH